LQISATKAASDVTAIPKTITAAAASTRMPFAKNEFALIILILSPLPQMIGTDLYIGRRAPTACPMPSDWCSFRHQELPETIARGLPEGLSPAVYKQVI
jgi:hypothetical protein